MPRFPHSKTHVTSGKPPFCECFEKTVTVDLRNYLLTIARMYRKDLEEKLRTAPKGTQQDKELVPAIEGILPTARSAEKLLEQCER